MGQFLRIAYLVSASSTACLDCNYCKPSSHFFYQLKTIFAFCFHFCDLYRALCWQEAMPSRKILRTVWGSTWRRPWSSVSPGECTPIILLVLKHRGRAWRRIAPSIVHMSCFCSNGSARGLQLVKMSASRSSLRKYKEPRRTTLTDDSSESPSAYPASQNVVVVNSTLVVLKTKDHSKHETRPKRPRHVYIYMFGAN